MSRSSRPTICGLNRGRLPQRRARSWSVETSYESFQRKLFQPHVDSPGQARRRLRSEVRMEWKGTRSESSTRHDDDRFREIRVPTFRLWSRRCISPAAARCRAEHSARDHYRSMLRRTRSVEVSKGPRAPSRWRAIGVVTLGRSRSGKRQVEELSGRASEDAERLLWAASLHRQAMRSASTPAIHRLTCKGRRDPTQRRGTPSARHRRSQFPSYSSQR